MRHRNALASWTVALAALSLAVASAPSVALGDEGGFPEILRRSIAHHGGMEAYRSLDLGFRLCSKSGCSDVEVRHDRDRWEHRVTGVRRGAIWTVVSSDSDLVVRSGGRDVAVPAEDESGWRDWANTKVWFSLLPFRLSDPSVQIEDRGVVDWDGRRLHELRVGFEPGTSTDAGDGHRYWFDPETGRLERFAYDFEGRPGGVRYRELHAYRRVGGVLLFDQRNLGIDRDGVRVDDLRSGELGGLRHLSDVEVRDARALESGLRD